MAKWGEGDPRWIVEERPDAVNVNNWHWSEKNATPWSKNRLKELLEGLKIEEGTAVVEFTTIKKCEGEATANNRKAKLIFLYEWEIEVNFIGRVAGSEDECKGHIEIPNLSDENDATEIDVNTNITTRSPLEAPIRHLLSKKGVTTIQNTLAVYIRELKEEFSKGLILPTDYNKPQVITKGKTTVVDKKSFQNEVITTSSPKNEQSSGVSTEKVEAKNVSVTESYKVPPERLYEVLTKPELVKVWANGNIVWDFRPDGEFSLFGGAVTGTFLRMVENKQIEFTWRLKSFPAGHHGLVRFILVDKDDSTDLTIDASNIPDFAVEETQNGFTRYYLMAISRAFGFGTRIF